MASETTSTNPAHQGKYKDVSLEAFNKAHGECSELAALYDGSKEADDLLLEATEELSYMKAPQDAHINEKPQAADYIDQALENIAQSWKNAENLEELFSLLEEAGASVEHLEKVLVEPLRQTPAFTGEGSGSSYELKSWPRIASVLTHLQQRGIHTEHLDIKVSKLDPDSMRKHPYVLINIHDESGDPQKGMQLLLCDQVGQVCFSSNVIYPAKYFETINKKMIAALPGMRREPQGSNIDSFIARLLSPLDNEKREKPFKAIFHKAVEDKSKAVEKIPLSEALYIKILKKEIEETGSSTLKKNKIYLPDGSTRGGLYMAFQKKLRGLTSCYKLVTDFTEAMGLSGKLTEDILDQVIKEYIKTHKGEEPSMHSGEVILPNGIKTNWENITLNIPKHILNDEDEPKYKSLADCKEKRGFTVHSYTAEDLVDLTRDWIKSHDGEEPTSKTTGDVFLKNGIKTTWVVIDRYVRTHPEKFGGLTFSKIKEQSGLKKGMAEYNEIIAQMQPGNDGQSGAPPAPLSIG